MTDNRLLDTSAKDLSNLKPVQEMVANALESNLMGRSQREVALEMGYSPTQSVMLSMIKKGTSRLPADKIFAAADALRIDPIELFAAYMKEQFGDDKKSWNTLKSMIEHMHSDEEHMILKAFQEAQQEKARPVIINDETMERLKKFIVENMMVI